nr:hypothetical protein [Tanacetum cinerariifolium]
GDEFVHPKLSIHEEEETKDEESFEPIVQTPKNSDDEGNDDASIGLNVGSEEGQDAEDDEDELYRDVNINLGRDSSLVSYQFVTSMLNLSTDAGIDSLFETTPRVDVQASTTMASLTLFAPTLPPPTIPTSSQVQQAPTPLTTAPSTFLQDLPNFSSLFGFYHCESASVEEPMQTTQDLEEPSHQEFETGTADDQPIAKASQYLEWFQQQKKPLTPNRAWNKTMPATHGSIQPWISDLPKKADSRSSFQELIDTPVDFSAFLMNRLKVDTLTLELLVGPTYELMKGS